MRQMRISEYSHRQAATHLSAEVRDGVADAIRSIAWNKNETAKDFREKLLHELAKDGWSNSIRVDARSKINITSIRDKIGLCFQAGNVSRFYADLLKLETLFRKGVIVGGVYVVPLKDWARQIGSNIASFERMVEELGIFEETITLPLIVFGITGR